MNYNIDDLNSEQIEALRRELLSSEGIQRLIEDLSLDIREAVDADLLSKYVALSIIQSGENELTDQENQLINSEDREFIEAMIAHSPVWKQAYISFKQNAIEASNSISENQESSFPNSTPAVKDSKKVTFFLNSFFWKLSAPIAAVIALVIILNTELSAPRLDDFKGSHPETVRGAESPKAEADSDPKETDSWMNENFDPLVSEIVNDNFDPIFKNLKNFRFDGNTLEQVQIEILMALAYIHSSETTILGLFRWYDKKQLQEAVLACDYTLAALKKNESKLPKSTTLYYKEFALYYSALSFYLMGDTVKAQKRLDLLLDEGGDLEREAIFLKKRLQPSP